MLVRRWLYALVLIMVFGMLCAADAHAQSVGGFTYTVASKKATITSYHGGDAHLSIPASAGGYPVVAIAPGAFKNRTDIATAVVPPGVRTIGAAAFMGCRGMTDVTLPITLTALGESVFRDSGLTGIWLPPSLKALPTLAFADCAALGAVSIPSSIRTIGNEAFSNCLNLKTATITKSTRTIGADAFSNCPALSIIAPAGAFARTYAQANGIPFAASGAPYAYMTVGGEVKILAYLSDDPHPLIPDALGGRPVTVIGKNAFKGRPIQSVAISAGIRTIEEGAFSECTALSAVVFEPGALRAIRARAFAGCSSLAVLALPPGVEAIGDGAFSDMHALAAVTLPDSIGFIGQYAFARATALTYVDLPAGVRQISGGLFFGCTGLHALTWPEQALHIGPSAFEGCGALEAVTLPDGVLSIGAHAFAGCARLWAVAVPGTLKAIAPGAFSNSPSLQTLALPSSVDAISEGAIPQSVAICAWPNSPARQYADAHGNRFIELFRHGAQGGGAVITGINGQLAELELPASIGGQAVLALQAGALSQATHTRAFSAAADHPAFAAVDGVLFDRTMTTLLAYPPGKPDGAYIIPDGVLSIAGGAFARCAHLNEVYIPESVAAIAGDAFHQSAPALYGHADAVKQYAQARGLAFRRMPAAVSVAANVPGDRVSVHHQLALMASVAPEDTYNKSVTFASSDPALASVDPQGHVTVHAPGRVTFTATAAAGKSAAVTLDLWHDYVPNQGLTLSRGTIVMGKKSTSPLTVAEFIPPDSTYRTVEWASSNTKIVTVSGSGEQATLQSAGRTGTATIRARSAAGGTATCKVTVRSISASMSTRSRSITEGQTYALNVRYRAYTPTHVVNTWSSTHPAVASVDADGQVTALSPGVATIQARTAVGTTVTCRVTVRAAVKHIALTGQTRVASGRSTTLKAAITPPSAYNKKLVWSSSNTAAARVSSSGRVTGRNVPSATDVIITARAADGAGALSAPYTITVWPAAKSVQIYHGDAPVSGTLMLNMTAEPTVQLRAEVLPATAYPGVRWNVSSASIASIDEGGLLTAKRPGTVSVKAIANDGTGRSKTVRVRITAG